MTGGPQSFGDPGYQKSPLERTLPVQFVEQKPKPKGRTAMGVFLLVDRSNSMSYNSRRRDVRDGEKMQYAKAAARALVAQLRPIDRVGVIAFDSDPYVLGPLRALSEFRTELEDRIARLMPGGGTDFKAALEIAASQLTASALPVRHIILLTDGDTNRGAADHFQLVQTLARMGITVTTIRIGDDDVNLELLQKISSDTGGRFYHVEDIERLPQLIVSDTRKVEEKQQGEEKAPAGPTELTLRLDEPSQVVRGFSEGDFPPLRNPVETRMKDGGDLVVYGADGGRRLPLLATWQYGLGRAGVFTLDPTAAEASQWVAWPGFAKLWSQLVRWAIREETPWETRQSIRFEEGAPFLEVQTFDDADDGAVVAQIFTEPQRSIDLQLTPVAPRLYRAPLPPLSPGRYALLLTRRSGDKTVSQRRDVLAIEASMEEGSSAELARKLPDLELLKEVAAETGGSVDPTVEQLTERHGGARTRRQSLDWLVVPLALALLLGDISLRRARGF
jgi:Mg-chelatase subunit ChlD